MSAFTSFLSNVLSQGWLKDQTHASKLYREQGLGGYDLAPKAGWIYYVKLGINPAAEPYLDQTWKTRYSDDNTVGLLAKSVDLPNFKITTENLNQYNRKTKVQTKLDYDPINITFHDDNANATNDLWVNYFRYNYSDGNYSSYPNPAGYQKYTTPLPAFNKRFTNMNSNSYNYGINGSMVVPFFNNITIFLFNKQKYLGFTLVNPMITEWKHGQVDQNQGNKFLDSRMTIVYENVLYSRGDAGKTGFSKTHYDASPSPLSIAGGGAANLLGPGGAVAGIEGISGALANGQFGLAALGTINALKNLNNLTANGIKSEITNVGISNIGGNFSANNTVGAQGVQIYSNAQTVYTNATQRNIK